jgi:hypothetical protein
MALSAIRNFNLSQRISWSGCTMPFPCTHCARSGSSCVVDLKLSSRCSWCVLKARTCDCDRTVEIAKTENAEKVVIHAAQAAEAEVEWLATALITAFSRARRLHRQADFLSGWSNKLWHDERQMLDIAAESAKSQTLIFSSLVSGSALLGDQSNNSPFPTNYLQDLFGLNSPVADLHSSSNSS